MRGKRLRFIRGSNCNNLHISPPSTYDSVTPITNVLFVNDWINYSLMDQMFREDQNFCVNCK